jgi:hypothetical protein
METFGGEDGLGMELDAFDRELAMAQPHAIRTEVKCVLSDTHMDRGFLKPAGLTVVRDAVETQPLQ